MATRWRCPPESAPACAGAGFDLQDPAARSTRSLISARHALVLQPEAQIALDRHLRIERVGLEHHADAAILGLLPGDVAPLMKICPSGDIEQARDAVEQGGLAAARRAEQDEKLALVHVEIQVPRARFTDPKFRRFLIAMDCFP
jgi:hypothetical protein